MVEIHQVHNQDHPLPKFNIDPQLNRRTTRPQDNPVTSTLVLDLPLNKDQEPHPAVTPDHHLHPHNKATGHQDLPVHPDRFKPNLRLLRHAGFHRSDHNHENDGRDQGFTVGWEGV
jgi:hypothetical protein